MSRRNKKTVGDTTLNAILNNVPVAGVNIQEPQRETLEIVDGDESEGIDLRDQLEEIKAPLANAGLLTETGDVDVSAIQEQIEDAIETGITEPPVEKAALQDAVAAARLDVVETPVDFSQIPAEPEKFEPAPNVHDSNISPERLHPREDLGMVSESTKDTSETFKPTYTTSPVVRAEEQAKEQKAEEVKPEPAPKASGEDLYKKYARHLTAEQLAAWTPSDMRMFDLHGVKPDVTDRGNYKNDRRRSNVVLHWTNNELLDWVEGKLDTPNGLEPELLWDEIYRRNRLPYSWTYDAVRAYLENRTQPAKSKNGLLIEDRLRDMKPVHLWSYLELRSGLLGEIPVTHSKEDLFNAMRKRIGLSETYPVERLLESLKQTPTESSVDNTLLRSRLEEYKSIMTSNPGTLSEGTAGTAQHMLYKAIRLVMAREITQFYEGWSMILDFVNENYPILFTPERARKGWSHIPIKGVPLTIFEDILTLIIHTRSPVGRAQQAKLYNMRQILRHVPSEKERTNIITYYTS